MALSLQLHRDPDDRARVDEASDLAVDRPRLSVYYEQGLVGGRDHVVAEDAGRNDRPVGRVPLRQARTHRLAHSRDHLDLACNGERRRLLRSARRPRFRYSPVTRFRNKMSSLSVALA